MEIKLTKEEWKFLHYSAKQYYDFYKGDMQFCAEPNLFRMAESFLEKLGSEWVENE